MWMISSKRKSRDGHRRKKGAITTTTHSSEQDLRPVRFRSEKVGLALATMTRQYRGNESVIIFPRNVAASQARRNHVKMSKFTEIKYRNNLLPCMKSFFISPTFHVRLSVSRLDGITLIFFHVSSTKAVNNHQKKSTTTEL